MCALLRNLVRICPLCAQWPITVRDGAIDLKGSHSVGDGRIFLKSLGDTFFNKDLSNEPNFGTDPSRWTVPLNFVKMGFRNFVLLTVPDVFF